MLHLNLRRVHRASALLLVALACAHIGNHLWALRGAAAHIELMDGLHAGSGAWFFGPYYFLAVVALFTHLGCALTWHMKAPSAHARRCVIGAAVLVGSAASASIIASLAGMTEPVDIPAAYKARFGARDKIGPEPVFRLIHAERVDGRDNK